MLFFFNEKQVVPGLRDGRREFFDFLEASGKKSSHPVANKRGGKSK